MIIYDCLGGRKELLSETEKMLKELILKIGALIQLLVHPMKIYVLMLFLHLKA